MDKYRRAAFAVAASLLMVSPLAAAVQEHDATLEEIPSLHDVRSVRKIVASRRRPSQYYVLDRDTHAVRVLGSDGMRLIGEIGNGPGELYYPFDLALASDDRLFIKDGGNKRIQILTADGRYLAQIPDNPKSEGLGVNKHGEVFLGQPATGRLLSVYDMAGKKIGAFGDLLEPSAIYGAALKGKDSAYRTSINRVRIAVDDEENVWVAFIHAPIVCKFDRSGKLLAKTTLQLPGLSALTAGVLQQPPPKKYMSQNLDGLPLTMVTKEIVIDRKTGQAVLLLGDDRIVFLGRDGSPARIIHPLLDGETLETLAADDEGALYTSKFSIGKMFRVVLTTADKEIGK